MKNIVLALAMAALSCGFAHAQEPAAPAATQTATVADALKDFTFLTDVRPAADAKFYVYLSSASWCPPCRAIMPKIVEQYQNIKADGGEIILICFDRTPEAGKAYLKKYSASFPTIMANSFMGTAQNLPGFTAPRGIPNAIFVAADGKLINNGSGPSLLNWKQIIADKL